MDRETDTLLRAAIDSLRALEAKALAPECVLCAMEDDPDNLPDVAAAAWEASDE